MKRILGLDLGTNSVGWALIEQDIETQNGNILGMGSRIIPTDAKMLGRFSSGQALSKAKAGQAYTPAGIRTDCRGKRHLYERHSLRRERLHRVLNILGFLPEHYAIQIDFEKHFGQFKDEAEPKLVYDANNQFIFRKSFEEMMTDFRQNKPELLARKNTKGKDAKIPYDWTIYYLRKKALSQKIEKEELAWLLLNFNQKRGYYQLRGEEEEETNKKEYVESLKVVSVEKGEPDKKNNKKTWYKMTFENGWEYSATFTTEPNWLNTEKEFLITEEYDENGNIKVVKDKKTDVTGKEKRQITPLPSFEEINLLSKEQQDRIYKKIKARTEITISNTRKTVGTYIYETLLENPNQKIRGKLVRTIERKFYKDELIAILKKQIELQPELFTEDLYNDCILELYCNNEEHQSALRKRNFVHLFVNDIIFYQRPLKSQKSSIGNCTLEYRKYKDKDGKEVKEYLKVIPKSNPLFQEFRLWQLLHNLKISKKEDDTDVTEQYITNVADKEKLFDFLNNRKEVVQKALLKYFKLTDKTHHWNYEEDKTFPCNETGTQIKTRLAKVENIPAEFLTSEMEQQLWHIIYSVTDKNEFEKALKTFANKHQLDEISFVKNFKNFPPFKSEYGSFSEKAIKKLLTLMRVGKYWDWETIDNTTKDRIEIIIADEPDEKINERVREKAINLKQRSDFQGLQEWLAKYVVYNRHSEAGNVDKFNSVLDLEKYLVNFKQHSLRNPIVEQVIIETLRVVKDIWIHFGNGEKDFFDEIHIELGREMKKTAEEREKYSKTVSTNENTNQRIKALILELKENSDGQLFTENVRPYSPIQQEALKIFEDDILNSDIEIPENILKISKLAQPDKSELLKYKLWLEQKYRSPYTGQIIPLGKLFTTDYEIEHIIPQSRYSEDSFNNRVICETAVNKQKDKLLGFEFIKKFQGQTIETSFGNSVQLFDEVGYKDFVQKHYAKNTRKRNFLLLEDIPEKMVNRQLNDTRYISKQISSVLSNIVREEKDDDGINSKNLLSCSGTITSTLKQDWGLNDIWNDMILSRFERLNRLTNSNAFTTWNEQYQKFLPDIPMELSKGFQKKRIDHRHHALDALIIACASRNHINFLNNQSALEKGKTKDEKQKSREDLRRILCLKKYDDQAERNYKWLFKKPWDSFTQEAKEKLLTTIVSFKQNLRVINKTTNKYQAYENGKKVIKSQEQTDSWAIRKPLHKDTFFAKVSLRKIKTVRFSEALKDWKMIVDKKLKQEIKRLITLYGDFKIDAINRYFKDRKNLFNKVDISKVEIYYFVTEKAAVRKPLDSSFTEKIIKESVTDYGIQKILINHLLAKENKPELAFSPEGIEEMNKNIILLNGGKCHQPINKVRVYESIDKKFQIGKTGNKKDKYVETAQGTNLFFAIYADENGNRSYETIPLIVVIERLKQGLKEVPEMNEKGHKLQFHLSPNDLVYVPTEDEKENITAIDWENLSNEQMKRLFVVNDFSNTCYFSPNSLAKQIVPKEVDLNFDVKNNKLSGSFDTKTASFEGKQIKDVCIKLKTDRLGNIKPTIY